MPQPKNPRQVRKAQQAAVSPRQAAESCHQSKSLPRESCLPEKQNQERACEESWHHCLMDRHHQNLHQKSCSWQEC
jgi:hypothetical protein